MCNESNEWYGTERAKRVTQKNRKKAGGKGREGCRTRRSMTVISEWKHK
jgi:hypothetical protein